MATQTQNRGSQKPGNRMLIVFGICAAIGLIGGLVGGVLAVHIDGAQTPGTSGLSASANHQAQCPVSGVARKVLPSVVTISAEGSGSGGTGSGEVIKSDGYILTNNHVIAPAAGPGGKLAVTFNDGKTAAAKLVGRDPLTDLAVIKVDENGLPAIPVGDSHSLVVGQPVVVLGAPLGLSSTVTSGIVSALDRTINVPGENSQSALLINAVQTDAAINPGNSGGSLVNCQGQFVGIPSAGATVPSESGESSGGSIGLGFAIPSDIALPYADEIISTGKVSHAYLGVQAAPVAADAAKVDGVAEGLSVSGVDPSGPAARAGLKAGDVITEVDGQPAVSTDQLVELAIRMRPGQKMPLAFTRDGATRQTTLTLAPQP